MSTEEAEIINESPSMAVATRPADAVAQPVQPQKPAMTAAQAKVDAVASLTMAAYQKAATLALTPEESAALIDDFPDEAFQPGAAGKEHLLYIEHAHLRDRFNKVFGLGQWAIIPRNRWNEPFRTTKGTEGERVYVEAMLVVRGCFVGEAVGAMEYYPKNESQNYGDAVEGAKTAAFRRCAKEFGVGLQAWKKDWCEGWWQRRYAKLRGKSAKPAEAAPTPAAKPDPAPVKCASETTRKWMIEQLNAGENAPSRKIVTEYFEKIGALLPGAETLEQLPLRFVPVSKDELKLLVARIGDFEMGEEATAAFPPHEEPPPPKPAKASKPVEVPRDKDAGEDKQEAWRTFPMPWGNNAGTPLEELDKKYLYGLWANYEVETEYQGKPKRPETIAKDQLFRDMLDQAGEYYEFTKKD